MPILKNTFEKLKANSTEIITNLSLFVGVPVVLSLYFDYRAGLLFLFASLSVTGLLALRGE